MSTHSAFFQMVEAAILKMQKVQNDPTLGTEDNPVGFGNVEFWKTDTEGWCYDKPTKQWDTPKIVSDLRYWF